MRAPVTITSTAGMSYAPESSIAVVCAGIAVLGSRYAPRSASTRPRSARIRPSASSASSTQPRIPRPCGEDSDCSRRSSVQRTGRPSSAAANATTGVSTGNVPLEPNPPPTSGTITRSDASSRRSICASCARGRCALSDDVHTVSRSPSGTASAPLPSSKAFVSRPITRSVRTTCAARANAPATSPSRCSQRAIGSPARGSSTAGSGSYSTSTCSARSSASARDSATTAATGCPTYRTSPSASSGCGIGDTSNPGGGTICPGDTRPARSTRP